jgi:hypothetical protein
MSSQKSEISIEALEQLPHDVVEFMQQILAELDSEYRRIRNRSTEDPGTAGDEGEENWAELLRSWLPATYQVVTKGRILSSLGEASPQMDVLVLHRDYPRKLLNKKHYFSTGVIAAFECKNTLRRDGIKKAIQNAKLLSEVLHRERGMKGYWRQSRFVDPVYDELHRPIIYGLLAHSHSWSPASARDLIDDAISELDLETSTHVREVIDIVCVADVAVWSMDRCASDIGFPSYPHPAICTSWMSCLHADRWLADSIFHRSFTTSGALLSRLYQKLSYQHEEALQFSNYFKLATRDGASGGGPGRKWGELLAPDVRARIAGIEYPRHYYY